MTTAKWPATKIALSSGVTTLTGSYERSRKIQNTGTGRIVLVGQAGDRLVLEPGDTLEFDVESASYRVACNQCGEANGKHLRWCPTRRDETVEAVELDEWRRWLLITLRERIEDLS